MILKTLKIPRYIGVHNMTLIKNKTGPLGGAL